MGRSGRTFFYDRSSSTNEHIILDDEDYEDDEYLYDDEPKPKPRTVYESMGVIHTQQNKRQEETSKKPKKKRCNKQSDRIIQMILQTTKLLEGRFTFSEILTMDIPTCKRIIDNEMYNIEVSIAKFQKTGKINAYTRNELAKSNDDYIKSLNSTIESSLRNK